MKQKLATILVLFAIGCCCSFDAAAFPPRVMAARELGAVSKPPTVLVRDGGQSALIGNKILWTFGDTLLNVRAVDGANARSNTAALANPSTPLNAVEPVDANGAPYQFLPFTPEEKRYNDNSGNPNERYALWVNGVIPDGNGNGIVFYLKLKVHPGFLNYEFIGIGLARVAAGQTVAVREPNLLFTSPEPVFGYAMLLDQHIYVYGKMQNGASNSPYAVARVPLAQAFNRSAYRFWNGANWVADITQSVAVMDSIPGAVTVSFNHRQKRYLAVHSGIFSNKVFVRTALRPEGPWHPPTEMFSGLPPMTNAVNYAGIEHPELSVEYGRKIYVSYFRPTATFNGELRLVEVKFR